MADKPDLDNIEMHMPEGDLAMPENENSHRLVHSSIIALLIILLLAILGGMYWWYITKLQSTSEPTINRPVPEENNEPESTTAEV